MPLSRTYKVAQRILYADVELDLPEARVANPDRTATWPALTPTAHGGHTVYRGEGYFSGSRHHIECRSSPTGYELTVDGVCRFHVDPAGLAIQRLSTDHAKDRDVLLGPALTLALALQGLFILHASAIVANGRAVCFLGESGSGKSTTAGYLEDQLSSVKCLVDDMAPFSLTDQLTVLPDFPQPKMDPTGTSRGTAPVPVTGLVWLGPGTEEREGIHLLTSRQMVERLIASTSCARLFDRDLLQHHLRFCGDSARRTKGFLSTGARQPRTLLAIRNLVATWLDV
jgi:hypothetical protein